MIDIKKQYKTKDGQEVRLISDQGRGITPIIGYIGDSNSFYAWTKEGCFISFPYNLEHPYDLIEVKPEPKKIKVSGWMNVYDNGDMSGLHTSKESAESGKGRGRIACKYIEFTVDEGEGL